MSLPNLWWSYPYFAGLNPIDCETTICCCEKSFWLNTLVLQINFTISYLNLQLWDYLRTEIPICSGEIHIFSGEIPIFPRFSWWSLDWVAAGASHWLPGSLPGNRQASLRQAPRFAEPTPRVQGKAEDGPPFPWGRSMDDKDRTYYIYIYIYVHHHIWLNVVKEYCISYKILYIKYYLYVYIYITNIYIYILCKHVQLQTTWM